MSTHRFPNHVVLKGFLVLLGVALAFQGFGMNGLAAPAIPSSYFQAVGDPPPLACTSSLTPPFHDIRIVLLIDDSGSMRTNDPQFLRNDGAKMVVNQLAMQYYWSALLLKAQNPGLHLPEVRLAVIHFPGAGDQNSGWIKFDPDGWKAQQAKLLEIIDLNKEYRNRGRLSLFQDAFKQAAELFTSLEPQPDRDHLTRSSILLFTDGTPEDQQGIFREARLKAEMDQVEAQAQQLADRDIRVYVTGFKLSPHYWDQAAADWSRIAANGPPLAQDEPSRSVLLEQQDSSVRLATRMEEIASFLMDLQAFAASPAVPDVTVEFGSEPVRPQVGKESHFEFKVVDRSGMVVLPGGDSGYSLNQLIVSVTQGPNKFPLAVSEGAGYYAVSWIPMDPKDGELRVDAKLTHPDGAVLLQCTSALSILPPPTATPTPTIPPPVPAIPPPVPALAIAAPCTARQKTITLPLRLNYPEGTARAASLQWNVIAEALPTGQNNSTEDSSGRQAVSATVNAINPERGDYEIGIRPGNAQGLAVRVSADAMIAGQLIKLPEVAATLKICSAAPKPPARDWLWLLAIVLAGLLIILLVLAFRSKRVDHQHGEDNQGGNILRRLAAGRRPWWLLWLLILLFLLFSIWIVFPSLNPVWLVVAILFISLLVGWLVRSLVIPRPVPPLPDPPPVSPSPEPEPEPEPDERRKEDELIRDDLTILEGIGPRAADILKDEGGITTFKQLAETDAEKLAALVKGQHWENIMRPETWPKQARLAEIARQSGKKIDQDIFEDYLRYLSAGQIPDE